MVCVVYACSMMSLLVRIQLNVIGGYIYLQNNNTSTHNSEVSALVPIYMYMCNLIWQSSLIGDSIHRPMYEQFSHREIVIGV